MEKMRASRPFVYGFAMIGLLTGAGAAKAGPYENCQNHFTEGLVDLSYQFPPTRVQVHGSCYASTASDVFSAALYREKNSELPFQKNLKEYNRDEALWVDPDAAHILLYSANTAALNQRIANMLARDRSNFGGGATLFDGHSAETLSEYFIAQPATLVSLSMKEREPMRMIMDFANPTASFFGVGRDSFTDRSHENLRAARKKMSKQLGPTLSRQGWNFNDVGQLTSYGLENGEKSRLVSKFQIRRFSARDRASCEQMKIRVRDALCAKIPVGISYQVQVTQGPGFHAAIAVGMHRGRLIVRNSWRDGTEQNPHVGNESLDWASLCEPGMADRKLPTLYRAYYLVNSKEKNC